MRYLTTVESFFQREQKHYVTIFMTATVTSQGDGDVAEPTVSLTLGRVVLVVHTRSQLMEPEKCDDWIWNTFQEMQAMSRDTDKPLFLPLESLVAQRPNVCAGLENS